MARNVEIRVEGHEVTVRAIKLYDMKLRQDLINHVRKTANNIRKKAKLTAPVSPSTRRKSRGKPGDLKASIRAKYFDGGLSATVVPRKPKGSHRHLVEYGTRNRRTSNGANRGRTTGNPFMNAAEQSEDAIYNRILEGMLNRDETV